LVTVIANGSPHVELAAHPEDLVRRIVNGVAPVRAMVKSPPAQRVIEAVRAARAVDESPRFLARQFGPVRPARYRLRRSGQVAVIRHRSRDVEVLNEIFGGTGGRFAYEPPTALGAVLDSKPSPRVLDLGGNVGLFGLYALERWPGASLRSFEPDAENARLLGAVIAENHLERRWSLTSAAVANRAGTMAFRGGLSADSHLIETEGEARVDERVQEVPVLDLFALGGDYDLVKMDIEGGEWGVLADPRMARFDADILVLEWHTQGCPEPDPRAHVIRLLREAGYGERYEPIEPSHCGMFWARRDAAPL
jgi:FkbM family methyltransferase